ncbi:Uncharacterised protein [uncultured archaeon]|nr:Uncharacterised protein [uncultured archaeon]
MKINTQDFVECFRHENRNHNVWADSNEVLLNSRNRDLKTCNEQLGLINYCIETSTQFINLDPNTDTSALKLQVETLKELRDSWKELKKLRIKKVLSPSYIMAYITKPGVIFHEISHWLACKCVGAKVVSKPLLFNDSIDYIDNMRMGYDKDTAKAIDVYGYVSHSKVNGYSKNFLIGFSPFIFGTLASIVVFFFTPTNILWIDILLGWLGFSIAYNVFPSIGSDDKDFNNAIIHDPKVHVPSHTRYFALSSIPMITFMGKFMNTFTIEYNKCRYNLYQILYPIFLFVIVELYKIWSLKFILSLSIAIILFMYYSIRKFKGIFTDMRNEYFSKS